MTARSAVVAQLERFDDDAWAALANRGLLRRARKDLDTVEVALVDDGESAVEVSVGEAVVSFDSRGPAHARCSCPSGAICQHIITAGLWLVGHPAAPDAPEEPDRHEAADVAEAPGRAEEPARAEEPDPAGALHRELMALTTDALVAHAGRAGHRWARQYALDLDPEHDLRIEAGRHTSISLPSPPVTFRYMGGGPASLIADVRLPSVEKYQAAAVLAYQRAHGVELADAEPVHRRRAEADATLGGSRPRLRASVARLLSDTIRLGVSHLSPAVHQRYETLAVWAQGCEYHRLALLLRRLADHVELQLARSARADEHRLLDEAAIACALVAALDAAEAAGEAPARLVGQARNRYDTVRTMELIGLGSLPWRTGSGYRGLTTLFWWPEESRFLSLTDARPETLRGFEPRQRHTTAGPWRGLGSPSAATGARVRLTDAQLSAAGRLSGVEHTHASLSPLSGPELAAALPAVASWAELEHRERPGTGLLDVPDPLRDWVVLAPAEFGLARFDQVGQSLAWEVRDAAGAVLPLTVAYSAESAHLVEQIERIASSGVADGTLLVCRLRSGPSGLAGEPLSLAHPTRQAAHSPVEALHFTGPDALEGQRLPRPRRAPRPAAGGEGAGGAAPARAPGPPAVLPPQLLDLQAWLVRQAERGTGAASPAMVGSDLLAHHRRLRDLGLDVFPAELTSDDVAVQLLRSHFLVLQVASLLSGDTAA